MDIFYLLDINTKALGIRGRLERRHHRIDRHRVYPCSRWRGSIHGVKGFVTEKKNSFRPTYVVYNIIATCVCIFAVVPLVLLSFTENELLVAVALALLMIIAGIGAGMFIVAGTQNASMQKLLKEGEFTDKGKKRTGVKEAVGFAYWGVLTAIYLTWSFLTNHWHISWLVYAIGGVLFPIVMMLCNLIADKDKKD